MTTSTPISFLARGGTTSSVGVGVGVSVDVGAGVGVSVGMKVGVAVGSIDGVAVGGTAVAIGVAAWAIGLAGVTAKASQPETLTTNKPLMMAMNKVRRCRAE
jgi:hypothetical protein